MTTIYTIGHGTRTIEEFIETLERADIARLIDVRRYPGSRRNPQFSRDALERYLTESGISYEHRGDTLGGRRDDRAAKSRHHSLRVAAFKGYADYMDTDEFRSAVIDLERLADTERIAIMCAETLWWKCHRRMISDALHSRGNEVVHLMKPGESANHKPVAEMRVGEDGWPVYDLGPLKLLEEVPNES